MGYIDRSLNQPSDTRSGLAQAALRRLDGGGDNGVASGAGPQVTGAPLPDPAGMADFLGGGPPPVPTVRDGMRARMAPDGSYRVDVRQLQEQVATAHDFASAAQRMLEGMQPIPSAGSPTGA